MTSAVQAMTGRLRPLLWTVAHPVRAHRAYIRAIEANALQIGRDFGAAYGPTPPPRRHLSRVVPIDRHDDTA